MNDKPHSFVVDASVGIKLFVDEPYSDVVHSIFSGVAQDPPSELYVPDLFYIECANILVKYIQRFGRSLDESQIDLADLKLLVLRSTPTEFLTADALSLAVEKRLSAYAACYAVLAKQLEIPLITADEPLVRAVDWAIWVGDYDPR